MYLFPLLCCLYVYQFIYKSFYTLCISMCSWFITLTALNIVLFCSLLMSNTAPYRLLYYLSYLLVQADQKMTSKIRTHHAQFYLGLIHSFTYGWQTSKIGLHRDCSQIRSWFHNCPLSAALIKTILYEHILFVIHYWCRLSSWGFFTNTVKLTISSTYPIQWHNQ